MTRVDANRGSGDSHNFGRRVVVGARRVRKPRSVFWERLLLSSESPLRRLLDQAAIQDGKGEEMFQFLPTLKFYPLRSGVGGEVERISLSALGRLSSERKRELAAAVGRSLALWSWLGVSDLHWENLVLGTDRAGRIVFAPLDIEMILSDLSLPTETKLIPDADPEYAAISRHASGVRRVLPFLGKPVAAESVLEIVTAYRATLALLDRHAKAIGQTLSSLPGLREAPIRVCLRGTDEYVRAHIEPPWPPLLDAEREQLERGDIPYFFRLYGQRGIRYYAEPSLKTTATLSSKGDMPQLDALLPLEKALRSPRRKTLTHEGLFTVIGAFDHVGLQGAYGNDQLELEFRPRRIRVKAASGEELHAKRDLSAFVSSAYLACRCGEVRSVFVPAVTRCEP